MKHSNIHLGDFVAFNHPKKNAFLKKGIVIDSKKESFVVKWTSYNKDFFLEGAGEEFRELNRTYLLGVMSYNRWYQGIDFTILNKAGFNELGS
jgi:hypothetical protein